MNAPQSSFVHDEYFDSKIEYIGRMSKDDVLAYFINRCEKEREKELRQQAQNDILQRISIRKDDGEPIHMGIFDIDQTISLLYAPVTIAGVWALQKLAQKHKIDPSLLFEASRQIPDAYLCHSERAYLTKLAEKAEDLNLMTNGKSAAILLPENNKDIISELHDLRVGMIKASAFQDVIEGIKTIKEKGTLVYFASNGFLASSLFRLHLWFGDKADDYIDGIVVRQNIDGLDDLNPHASESEKAFITRLYQDDKIKVFPEKYMKPDYVFPQWCLAHANQHRQEPIKVNNVAVFGDSLSSDGGCAKSLGYLAKVDTAKFIFTVKAMMIDPFLKYVNRIIGEEQFVPDSNKVRKAVEKKTHNFPHVVYTNFKQVLNNVAFEAPPRETHERNTTLDRRAAVANLPDHMLPN